jgi:hypothetical protein
MWVGSTKNRVNTVLLSALITLSTVNGIFLALVCANFIARQNLGAEIAMTLLFAVILGVAILILLVLGALGRRVIAARPEQCWSTPLDLNRNAREESEAPWYESHDQFQVEPSETRDRW